MNDLPDLSSQLKTSPSPYHSNYQHPGVSSPTVTPPISGPQPRYSNIMSSANTPQLEVGGSDKAIDLLNLLKFNQPASRSTSQSAIPVVGQTNAPTSQPANNAGEERSAASLLPTSDRASSRPPAGNPQDMLLNLLKRSESGATAQDRTAEKQAPSEARSVRETTPARALDGASGRGSPFQPQQPAPKPGIFSYVNPFDQLPASAGHRKPSHHSTDSAKAPSNTASPAPSKLPGGRSQLEALMGIGSKKPDKKPVAEAVEDVAGQADQDAQDALESAEVERATEELAAELAETNPEALKEAVHDAAVEIQDELHDGKTKSDLEKTVSKPVADALQETVDDIVKDGVVDNWESAEVEDVPDSVSENTVKVYNLPMRPFVSLDINGEASKPAKVRNDVVMKIAALKKEFDQIDRTLASASPNYIVYAMAKGGGFRVIRQDDGSNKTNFRGAENVMFSVSISHQPRLKIQNELTETVLATGTSGAIFWTSIPINQDEPLEKVDLDKRGFIMPPLQSTDENTSTSQLKTRVKKSSRHPEFFAYGRGKSIYLVYPTIAGSATYINPESRVIDTQRYLGQRMLKIATGKAGKDFTFSEDDSVIVSLDKHGRLKFWDITDHLALANETLPGRPINMESKIPVSTLWLTSSSTKAWPTSVQFVDKDRPTAKGIASRYILVGLKQNHTLQLWDLGLGKAVQELNLPHANETDAICSIAYHAKSGIIVVGHPTRNSIYFIHLSAPKYTVPSMSQASFLHGLVNKESRIPRPDSTAIMSGLREISLEPIGSMRSIDILSPSPQTADKDGEDDETVLEVYVMHSRGVTCLNLKKQDFGWGKDGKVVHGRDAEAEGVVVVGDLQVGTPAETGQSEESRVLETPSKTVLKPFDKSDIFKDPEVTASKPDEAPPTPKQSGASTKADKKKTDKKKLEEHQVTAAKPPSYADALSRARAPPAGSSPQQPTSAAINGTILSTAPAAETTVPASEDAGNAKATSASYISALTEQMNELFSRMDEQRRISDVANDTRLETVLRLVSATLTENVEKSLHRIVSSSINDKVIPSIADVTSATLEAKVPNVVSHQVAQSVPGSLKASMPDAIAKSLQAPGVLQTISEHVAAKLAPQIEKHLDSTMKSSVLPAFTRTATDAARSTTVEVENRVLEQLRAVQTQNQHDQTKIDHLARSNSELVSTITDMAGMQGQLLKELAALRGEMLQMRDEVRAATVVRSTEQAPPDDPAVKMEDDRDEEFEAIAQAMANERPEEATIRWLQSPNQSVIFNDFFAAISPADLLPRLNPIVNLSVSAAVSSMLGQGRTEEKLGYLETVLQVVDPRDGQIAEYAPRMMEVLKDRVGDEFMRVAEERPSERALLTRLRGLAKNVEAFRSMVGQG